MGLGIAGVLSPSTTSLMHNLSTMAISAGSTRLYLDKENEKK